VNHSPKQHCEHLEEVFGAAMIGSSEYNLNDLLNQHGN
jgi:hypothetical protein